MQRGMHGITRHACSECSLREVVLYDHVLDSLTPE